MPCRASHCLRFPCRIQQYLSSFSSLLKFLLFLTLRKNQFLNTFLSFQYPRCCSSLEICKIWVVQKSFFLKLLLFFLSSLPQRSHCPHPSPTPTHGLKTCWWALTVTYVYALVYSGFLEQCSTGC